MLHTIFGKQQPQAHVLMPVYNGENYILQALKSIAQQYYPNIKVFIVDDGSTDNTVNQIELFLKDNPAFRSKINLVRIKHAGETGARETLYDLSFKTDPKAFKFNLDADDQFIIPSFIGDVIERMMQTNANICLYNVAVKFEDESQRRNASVLFSDLKTSALVLDQIDQAQNHSINPMELDNILNFTSLGGTKVYGPRIRPAKPHDFPYPDFVYMATLLQVNKITAMPSFYEPVEYLRRADATTGRRTAENFIFHIPAQLERFFKTVLAHDRNNIRKIELAAWFVRRKLNQYSLLLDKIVNEGHIPTINVNTRSLFQREYMNLLNAINMDLQRQALFLSGNHLKFSKVTSAGVKQNGTYSHSFRKPK